MNGSRAITMKRRLVWSAVIVAFAALLAYGAALAGSYVFDDVHSVAANPAIHDLANLGRYWVDPSAFSPGLGRMYRPALLSTFALNWAVCAEPWSLKAGNVLLHAATSVLVFVWLWRLTRRSRAASCVAVWFAVHPLASEAVNLVSARSELLATFGMLVVLLAHLSWQRREGNVGPVLVMLAGTVLACGSKETGAVVPLLAAAQALWLRHARFDRAALRRCVAGLVPIVVAVVAYLVARKLLLGQMAVPLLGRAGDDPGSGHGRSLVMQLATMGTLLPGVLLQMLLPLHQSLDPAITFRASFADPAVVGGWTLLTSLSLWAVWPGPSARLRRLGVVFAWTVALPWIVVPLNQPLAEHRFYGPLVGVAAIAVATWPRLRAWLRRTSPRALLPVAVGTAVLGVAAIGMSAARSLDYRDERDLWRIELARNPDSFRAWWGLGTSQLRAGDLVGAIEPLQRAHALYPRHFDTHRNLAEALISLPDDAARPEQALAVTADLVRISPGDPWARSLQAQAELQAGRCSQRTEHFERAESHALACLQLGTPKGYVFRLAAQARRGLKDLPGALAHLDDSIARGLAPVAVRLDRVAVLRELGRLDEARRELARAQREAPMDPAVMNAVMQFTAAPGR